MSIRVRRVEAGLTQVKLAQALGVTQSAVSQWDNGEATPTIANLKKIAELCDCTVDDLIKEE